MTSKKTSSKKAPAKKKSATKAPAKKKSATKKKGGAREGAGRKPTLGKKMQAGIYVRCSDEQKDALQAHVDKINAARAEEGIASNVAVSEWMRELALKHSGNEHLGAAARAMAASKAAASIV